MAKKILAETKQQIVHNLSDVDEIIEIIGEDVDVDPAGITLRYLQQSSGQRR
jgi:hypothetical protein